MSSNFKIGIIGGTGLEDPSFLGPNKQTKKNNEFGQTSSDIFIGEIADIEIFIISRHGVNHQFSPSAVNYRANIKALSDLGCTHILASTACGSLREEFAPGDFVLPDQFIDWTKNRVSSFYDGSEVKHTAMSEPFSKKLSSLISDTSEDLGLRIHNGGTVISIEGPRFSTKAESLLFKRLGCDIINMTTSTESSLSKEAGIPYQAIAMVTDYDCWKEASEEVSMEIIQKVMKENSNKIKLLLESVVKKLGNSDDKGLN